MEDDLHKASTQLKAAKDQLAASFSKNHVDDIIAEKEEQIQGLMEEGEKLSKQQLTYNTTIKKLRARLKESDEKLKKTEERAQKAEEFGSKTETELKELQVFVYLDMNWINKKILLMKLLLKIVRLVILGCTVISSRPRLEWMWFQGTLKLPPIKYRELFGVILMSSTCYRIRKIGNVGLFEKRTRILLKFYKKY